MSVKRAHKRQLTVLSVIILVTLVACALAAVVPHGHEGFDAECAICYIIDTIDNLLLVTALSAVIRLLSIWASTRFSAYERSVALGASTPVRLKVKLSD